MNNALFSPLLVACALCFVIPAQAQEDSARGELLYTTHCSSCHSTEIHWREKRLARDWSSLIAQVQRWQAGSDLHWSAEEIFDVAHYLNALHYGFPEPAHHSLQSHLLRSTP